MARFSLSPYVFHIREVRGEQDDREAVSDFGGNDFYAFLAAHLGHPHAAVDDDKFIKFGSCVPGERQIEGLIETGDYGYESDLVDVGTGSQTHHRQINEAELLPFYYLFEVPEGQDEGILLLQRFQQFGVRHALVPELQAAFRSAFKAYRLIVNPIVTGDAWRAYIDNSDLKAVHFIRYQTPTDIADAYDQAHREDAGQAEFVLHSRRGRSLPLRGRIADAIAGRRQVTNIIEIPNFDYDRVKVVVQQGATERVLLLDKPQARVTFDITDRVTTAPNGHPTFASVSQVAKEIVTELRDMMGGGA